MATVIIGAKIGQRHERTGIAVVEAERRGTDPHYVARHLERLPAGTSYPDATKRLAEVWQGAAQHAGRKATGTVVTSYIGYGKPPPSPATRPDLSVYVDVTGLGDSLLALIKTAGIDRPNPVYFTHGDRRIVDKSDYRIEVVTLGKCWLVARLQVLLQTGRLHLPETREAERLAKDLRDYQIEVAPDANERYGAFTVGQQDDLITALGLAVQKEEGIARGFTQENRRGLSIMR